MSKMREEKQIEEIIKTVKNEIIARMENVQSNFAPGNKTSELLKAFNFDHFVKYRLIPQLSLAHSQGVKEERERIVKKIDYLLNEKLHSKQGIHNFDLEFNNGLKAAKQIINSLTPEKEE